MNDCFSNLLPAAKHPVPGTIPGVMNGDLVFRKMSGPGSRLVDAIDEGSIFSHVGIAYVDADTNIFVIHVLPQGDEMVQMDTLPAYLQEAELFAVYRPVNMDRTIPARAAQIASQWVGVRPFDKDFDLSTDDALYCTELVYKAYLLAGQDVVDGIFNQVSLPFLTAEEVIYPSLLVQSSHFTVIYSSPSDNP